MQKGRVAPTSTVGPNRNRTKPSQTNHEDDDRTRPSRINYEDDDRQKSKQQSRDDGGFCCTPANGFTKLGLALSIIGVLVLVAAAAVIPIMMILKFNNKVF